MEYREKKGRTGSSASVIDSLTDCDAFVHGKIGTRNSIGAVRESGSKSGIYAKSIVELSFTALRLRLVLKWRTLLPVSEASGTGMVVAALERRGADAALLATGLSDVRSEEKVAGPVMESWRVEILLPTAMARVKTREVCIVDVWSV